MPDYTPVVHRRIAIVAGLTLAGGLAAGPARSQNATASLYVVSYVEVAPAAEGRAEAVMRKYRDASRRDAGSVKVDVLQGLDRRGHFVVLEEWRDEAARKNHRAAPHVARLQEELAPLRISGYDERSHTAHAVGPARAVEKGSLLVVTHIDVIPANGGADKARAMLKALAESSRSETGNLRFDVLQGARMNHFTVIEAWRDARARDAHVTAAHTKTFRNALQPLGPNAGLYDERLYRALR